MARQTSGPDTGDLQLRCSLDQHGITPRNKIQLPLTPPETVDRLGSASSVDTLMTEFQSSRDRPDHFGPSRVVKVQRQVVEALEHDIKLGKYAVSVRYAFPWSLQCQY